MKFEIARITQTLDLGEYNEAYAGMRFLVWVNPPRELLRERERIIKDGVVELSQHAKKQKTLWSKLKNPFHKTSALSDRMFGWLEKIWNQHDEEDCKWTLAEIRQLYDLDPAFYQWLTLNTVRMLEEFRAASKKK